MPAICYHVVFLLQQALVSLVGQLVISLLVADVVCASDNEEIKTRLFSSTMFMSGVTTVCMTILGVRLVSRTDNCI